MANVPASASPYGETIQYGGCECCGGTPPCNCCLDAIPDCTVTITDCPCPDLIGIEVPIQNYQLDPFFFCSQQRQTNGDSRQFRNFSNQTSSYTRGVDVTNQIADIDTFLAPIYSNMNVPSGAKKAYLYVYVGCINGLYSIIFHFVFVAANAIAPGTDYVLAWVTQRYSFGDQIGAIDVNCCPFALTFTDVPAKRITNEVQYADTVIGGQFIPCLWNDGLWSFALTGTRTGCTGEGGGD